MADAKLTSADDAADDEASKSVIAAPIAGATVVDVKAKESAGALKTPVVKSQDDSDDEETEILEESPCGRWQKRREQVKQRDVPGIDQAYLAMDTEEGVEVVWNEVQFSERKKFRAQEAKIKAVFDNLTQLRHANLVKFHKYWMDDTKSDHPRVIFITEYMSSGSMSNFLKRTRQSSKNMSAKAWKKWVTQILSALNYLHSSDPPILHGNLSCNGIFIQHNGLIKIGCVAPDAIHHHVKTFRENMKNMHYIAPEFEVGNNITPAADLYSFGICALEMAALGFQTNGEGQAPAPPQAVSKELIQKTIQSLEDPFQRNFIEKCLHHDPLERPSARALLFHKVLFEVHSLKLLAAHTIVSHKQVDAMVEDIKNDENKTRVIAVIPHSDGREAQEFRLSQVAAMDELDKFLEDVRNGVYPLIAFATPVHQEHLVTQTDIPAEHRSVSPVGGLSGTADGQPGLAGSEQTHLDAGGSANSADAGAGQAEQQYVENRRVIQFSAEIKKSPAAAGDNNNSENSGAPDLQLSILLRMDDQMNRQLTSDITFQDTPDALANELVFHGFIHKEDCVALSQLIAESLARYNASLDTKNVPPKTGVASPVGAGAISSPGFPSAAVSSSTIPAAGVQMVGQTGAAAKPTLLNPTSTAASTTVGANGTGDKKSLEPSRQQSPTIGTAR